MARFGSSQDMGYNLQDLVGSLGRHLAKVVTKKLPVVEKGWSHWKKDALWDRLTALLQIVNKTIRPHIAPIHFVD